MARSRYLAIVGVFIVCIAGSLFVLIERRESPKPVLAIKVSCLSNLRQIGMGTLMYASDEDNHLPLAASWYTSEYPYLKNPDIACVDVHEKNAKAIGYAFNSPFSGASLKKMKKPEQQILIYDSTSFAVDTSDPVTSLPSPGRHKGNNNICYADGHVNTVPSP